MVVNNRVELYEMSVSVIIPVYNVKPYLQQCLDSVIWQTYEELEIIIVDDGSTDGSDVICDVYRELDRRVQVIHQANLGLSAARNAGLDVATGDYIMFVDSDDWLELTAIEQLYSAIASSETDIAVCKYYVEKLHGRRNKNSNLPIIELSEGKNILRDYLQGKGIENVVWNKLYCRALFEQIRFPAGRNYEDIATTYKLLGKANRLVGVPQQLIHYRQRESGINHSRSLDNLMDYWTSHHEKYEALIDQYDDCRVKLVSSCIHAIERFWCWYYGTEDKNPELVSELQAYAREHENEVLKDTRYTLLVRVFCFTARFSNPLIFWVLYRLSRLYQLLIRQELYE